MPEGDAVVLDVPQLETLLRKTFNLGLDVGRGAGEPRALVRLRLAKSLLGVVESNATAAKGIAIEREISAEGPAANEAVTRGNVVAGCWDRIAPASISSASSCRSTSFVEPKGRFRVRSETSGV
ncbi:MAG: hypothetical protein ACXVII_44630 [Solirubrobacteraceae bacterium]